jgi:hypothetical protein
VLEVKAIETPPFPRGGVFFLKGLAGAGGLQRRAKGGAMRRAFLIVGFNNWGKTTLVYDLFRKQRFLVGECDF